MPNQLPQIESQDRAVPRSQRGRIAFHPAFSELASMFRVTDEWLDSCPAVLETTLDVVVLFRLDSFVVSRSLKAIFLDPLRIEFPVIFSRPIASVGRQ